MFIAERLIGVGIYSFALVMVCFFLTYSTIGHRAILRCYTAALCVMAFFYQPHVTADLYRIYAMAREFAGWSFRDFFQLFVVTNSVPGARIFYWCAGRAGMVQLIPAMTSLVCFSCIFYMLSRSVERNGVGRRELSAALFFFMATGNYMMLISNIRTMLSASLIAYCFYRESVEKKYRFFHLALYAAAASVHNLGVVLIVLRLAAGLLDRQLTMGKRIVYMFSLGVAVLWIWRIMGPVIAEKVRDYVFGDRYSYFWEYVIGSIALMVELWVLRGVRRMERQEQEEYFGMRRFLLVCVLTALAFCFEFSVFYRFVNCIGSILTAPLLMAVLQDKERKGEGGMAYAGVTGVSVCLLFLSCCRGSLCSIKFFTL